MSKLPLAKVKGVTPVVIIERDEEHVAIGLKCPIDLFKKEARVHVNPFRLVTWIDYVPKDYVEEDHLKNMIPIGEIPEIFDPESNTTL